MAEPEAIREEKERHHYAVEQMADFYRPWIDVSSDGVFIYLDDEHKTCNRNCADMFGYTIEEWSAIHPFLERLVAPESRRQAAADYAQVSEDGISRISHQTLVRKDGSTFRADMAMVPVMAGDDFFTINLIREL